MNNFKKVLQSYKFVPPSKKTLAFISFLSVVLPMAVASGQAQAYETLQVNGGMALNVYPNDRRINGNPRVSLFAHNLADQDQQFTRLTNPDGSLRFQNRSTGKCLNAHTLSNGGELNVWPCNPNDPDQKFDLVSINYQAQSFQIRRRGTNLCIDSPTRDRLGRIHLWTCDSSGRNPSQRWISSNASIVDPPSQGKAESFFRWANGQRGIARLDRNDLNGQCVTLVVRYLQDVYFNRNSSLRAYGHGKDVARGVASQHPTLFRYTTTGIPKRGAIISFEGNGYNTTYGHVGIVLESRADGSFRMLDSNSDGRNTESIVTTHSWRGRGGVTGWADPITPLP